MSANMIALSGDIGRIDSVTRKYEPRVADTCAVYKMPRGHRRETLMKFMIFDLQQLLF